VLRHIGEKGDELALVAPLRSTTHGAHQAGVDHQRTRRSKAADPFGETLSKSGASSGFVHV
jgi:hypothetical protein